MDRDRDRDRDRERERERERDLRSGDLIGDFERVLMCELGESFLDISIDFDLERDREFLTGDGECFPSKDGEGDVFFSQDIDLLRDFRFGLFDGDRDFGEFDRDLIAAFGDPEGEQDGDCECALYNEGDLEQEREFTFGEESGLLRLVDVDLDLDLDLDLDREFSRDAKSRLFLDSSKEELLDLDTDFAERIECGDSL